MGHKANPISLRLGITEGWRSRWYAGKAQFGRFLVQDQRMRRLIKKNYAAAGINRIIIERTREEVKVLLHCARPGVIIGRSGIEVERLGGLLEDVAEMRVNVQIQEVGRPEAHAELLAQSIAEQLARRSSYKRTIKRAAEAAMGSGILGVRIRVAGRLGGSEMARIDDIRIGSIPLHTFRAKVDYGFTEAKTKVGHIGVKVWTYSGDMEESNDAADA